MHPDGRGLYLQVTPGKFGPNKSWVFRYEVNGRDRYMGLGSTLDVSLAEAREEAAKARKLRREGLDPLEEKRARRAAIEREQATAITFDECRDRYIAAHRASWRSAKHAAQWTDALSQHISPTIGAMPVREIDTADVLRALEPVWLKRPVTAGRLRGRVESILDWAKVRGYRDGENPARWGGHLKHTLAAHKAVHRVKHHPALPYNEIGAFMVKLRERGDLPATALEFTILTASRSGEALGARWDEIDLDEGVWTVPAERTKRHKELRIPLSRPAVALLERVPRGSALVFPGRKGRLGPDILRYALRVLGHAAITTHGFRSTFRTWAAEQTNFPREICEAALGHTVGDETERAYQRGDLLERRRKLMEAWATYCARPAAIGDVVPMQRAAL
jgi:integrase